MSVPLFASGRERALWIWVLVVVTVIYSTLGLTGALAAFLHDRGLSVAGFLLGMLLVGATIVTQGLMKRPNRAEICVGLGIAAVWVMLFVRLSLAERSHLMEYGVLAVFIHEALRERARHRRVPVPALLAFLTTVLLGAIDEGVQWWLPSRVFDIEDIGFNTLAAFMAIGTCVTLAWARRWIGGLRSR